MKEEVKEKFKSLNCGQIVFSSFDKTKDILPLASGFGGGFGEASLCGSYGASLGVLGVYFEGEEYEEKVEQFKKEYDKTYKSKICKEILHADLTTKKGMEYIEKNNLFGTTCVDLTCECVEILKKITKGD